MVPIYNIYELRLTDMKVLTTEFCKYFSDFSKIKNSITGLDEASRFTAAAFPNLDTPHHIYKSKVLPCADEGNLDSDV